MPLNVVILTPSPVEPGCCEDCGDTLKPRDHKTCGRCDNANYPEDHD